MTTRCAVPVLEPMALVLVPASVYDACDVSPPLDLAIHNCLDCAIKNYHYD